MNTKHIRARRAGLCAVAALLAAGLMAGCTSTEKKPVSTTTTAPPTAPTTAPVATSPNVLVLPVGEGAGALRLVAKGEPTVGVGETYQYTVVVSNESNYVLQDVTLRQTTTPGLETYQAMMDGRELGPLTEGRAVAAEGIAAVAAEDIAAAAAVVAVVAAVAAVVAAVADGVAARPADARASTRTRVTRRPDSDPSRLARTAAATRAAQRADELRSAPTSRLRRRAPAAATRAAASTLSTIARYPRPS